MCDQNVIFEQFRARCETLEAQLETARTALEESEASKAILSKWIMELKAQIGAGQKGGK